MHGARLTWTPRRNWPHWRRFRHDRLRIDRLVGTGNSVPPWPLRTHSPFLLRTRWWRRGRHLRRLAGNRYLTCRTSMRDGSRRSFYPALCRENRWPRPGRHRVPKGCCGGGHGNPCRDRGPSGGAADHGGRDGSGPLERALHGWRGLGRGRRSSRSSGSRWDNGLRGRRRSHDGLARGRLNVRNRAGQRLEVRLKVVQLLQIQHRRHVRRFHGRRR